MSRLRHIILLGFVVSACATHPTLSPIPLKQGETYMGYTLSAENVLPLIYYRYGLTDNWDIGLRIGLPIYGSGIDISRLLVNQGDRSDILNLAYSFNPNHNIDYTYYRVVRKIKVNEKDQTTRKKLRYYGMRGMLITNGISGRRSHRFGILIGGAPAIKWGEGETPRRFYRFQWELGYFHDFNSMPIRAVIDPQAFNAEHPLWETRFADYPHTAENGLPSEFSRLTGLSFRLSFPLGTTPAEPPAAEGP